MVGQFETATPEPDRRRPAGGAAADGLAGKVALITGAARGQGRSHAITLARAGVSVIAVDICEQISSVNYPLGTADDLRTTVDLVTGEGTRAVAVTADTRDVVGLGRGVDAAVADLGRLDIVIANAGVFTSGPTLELSQQAWQDCIDVNLTGTWNTVRAGIPHILRGGLGGSVVMIGSMAAVRPNENTAPYAAAKAGQTGLMQVLAKELAGDRITVNSVSPGTVDSPMIRNEAVYRLYRPDLPDPGPADFEQVARGLNRMGVVGLEPIDVSRAVMYLVSEAGRYVTGTTMLVDAGARFL